MRIGVQKPFQCMRCSRAYSRASDLTRHLRLECGVEPQFQCPHCPKRCRHNYHLNSHIINKHSTLLPGN
ncbi:early growth response protein 2-like isoform X2 [Homalodisca vitripennis]|uniref:early growth response protein 2-like isoform X2 n=1 Tax=Homalodisca vitripennis TaxID=197043 RepID=UPI001EEA9300|nr:early growth response protein 2-like isoform X2 [Homalodisca vitripennis]